MQQLEEAGNFHLIDMNPYVCPDRICTGIVGNVYVFLDTNHFTPRFTRTLWPEVRKHIGEYKPEWVEGSQLADR